MEYGWVARLSDEVHATLDLRVRNSLVGLLLALGSAPSASAVFEVQEATIARVHRAMQAGELTCVELVQMYLDRIETYDRSGPSIQAVIIVNPVVEAQARSLDRKFESSGLTGPLHCVPVLLKDNVQTADMPTTGGSLSLEGWRVPSDAFLTKKLRQAGALILAKVNLTEFAASGITKSSILGQTRNPYDLTRTPGGSSGGTGAGVASNFGMVGIGTDTVNSIRSPSSANSLVGIRPTRGLVSRSGVIPYALTQDMAGPIARTVADAARVLDVIAGYDPEDATTAWSFGKRTNYTTFLDSDALKGVRLGVLDSFFGTGAEHQEVNSITEAAIRSMEARGARIQRLTEPIDADQLIREVSVSAYEFNAHLSHYLESSGAPVASLGDILASGKYEAALERLYMRALSLSVESEEYRARLMKRTALRERVMHIMAQNRLDAIVYPHQKRLVVPIGEDQVDRNGVLGAITGFPAITVPAGFSRPTSSAPIGVPVGIEFLGRPFTEGALIGITHAFEKATKHRRPPEFGG